MGFGPVKRDAEKCTTGTTRHAWIQISSTAINCRENYGTLYTKTYRSWLVNFRKYEYSVIKTMP
ncbi:hypothetical protein DEN88_25600 [Escherichia coli]|nr:hypothetical protein [Escherichia coli]EEX2867719.1 hypothetical protein [Escherichia coli]EFB6176834.1 hypothetical protein [Escherichia coli]EFC4369264.1 hypothetical protein [Escherichia coli]EFC6967071.1 hypothetical protein [Escherichia coli]